MGWRITGHRLWLLFSATAMLFCLFYLLFGGPKLSLLALELTLTNVWHQLSNLVINITKQVFE